MPLVPLEPTEAPQPSQVFLVTRWCAAPPLPSPSTPSSSSAFPTPPTYSPESRPWICVICSLDMLSTDVWNGRPQGATAFLDVHDLNTPGHNPCIGIPHDKRLWAVFLYGKGIVRWVKKEQLWRFKFYDPYLFVGVGPEEKRQFHQLFLVVKNMLPLFRDKEKRLLFWRARIRQADADDHAMVVAGEMRMGQRGRQQAKPVALPVNPFRDDERDELDEMIESARSGNCGKGKARATTCRMRNHLEDDDRLNHVWKALKTSTQRSGRILDNGGDDMDADVDGQEDQNLDDDGLISDEELLTTLHPRKRLNREFSSDDGTLNTDNDSDDNTPSEPSQPDEADEELDSQRLDLEVDKNLIAEGEARLAALAAELKAQKRKTREDEERLQALAKKKRTAKVARDKHIDSDVILFGNDIRPLPRDELTRSPTAGTSNDNSVKRPRRAVEGWGIGTRT